MALFDGAELAKAICSADSIEEALDEYEQAMFVRSKAEAVEAHRMLALFYDERAPHSFIEFLSGAAG